MTMEAYETRMAREAIKMDKDKTMLNKDKKSPGEAVTRKVREDKGLRQTYHRMGPDDNKWGRENDGHGKEKDGWEQARNG